MIVSIEEANRLGYDVFEVLATVSMCDVRVPRVSIVPSSFDAKKGSRFKKRTNAIVEDDHPNTK